MAEIETNLKKYCLSLGFDLFGICSPALSENKTFFQDWLQKKYQADMEWLEKNKDKRFDPNQVLPNCQTIIVLGCSYFNRDYTQSEKNDPDRALIARYAWGEDYHLVLPKKLKLITAWLDKKFDKQYAHKYYTDTGPLLEKELGVRAGLGFIGNNTLLINPQLGSYFFLAIILTQANLSVATGRDLSLQNKISCGTCRRCLDACPTKALIFPHCLDARRCISYQTIENREEIPAEIKEKIKNRIFGCDICQEVCPWNNFAQPTRIPEFQTKNNVDKLKISEIRDMTKAEYQVKFQKSAIKRAKFEGLKRNINT